MKYHIIIITTIIIIIIIIIIIADLGHYYQLVVLYLCNSPERGFQKGLFSSHHQYFSMECIYRLTLGIFF
jgi:hypothetical protein